MSNKRPVVLIVEDEPLVRDLLSEAFDQYGFEAITADHGDDTAQTLRSSDDVRGVLTDVELPGSLKGFDIARIARNECPDCLIVIASGRPCPSGGDLPDNVQLIRKPFRVAEMVLKLASLLVG